MSNITINNNNKPLAPFFSSSMSEKTPGEIVRHILGYLSLEGNLTCSTLNKSWNQLIKADFHWKYLALRHFGIRTLASDTRPGQQLYKECLALENIQKLRFTTCPFKLNATQDLLNNINLIEPTANYIFSSDANKLITESAASDVTTIRCWDLKTVTLTSTFTFAKDSFNSILSKDEQSLFLLTGLADTLQAPIAYQYDIEKLDLNSGTCTVVCPIPSVLNQNGNFINCLLFNKEQSELYVGNWHGGIHLFSMVTGEQKACLISDLANHHVSGLILSHDEKQLISSHSNQTQTVITIWDLSEKKCLKTYSLPLPDARNIQLALNPQGDLLVVSNKNNKGLFFLDLTTEVTIDKFDYPCASLNVIQDTLLFAQTNGRLSSYDLSARKLINHDIYTYTTSLGRFFTDSFFFPSKMQLLQVTPYCNSQKIVRYDFQVASSQIFESLASQFEQVEAGSDKEKELVKAFERMPEQEKQRIFAEMRKIKKSPIGASAFLGHESYSSTPAEKAQAIRNYLANNESK